MKTLARLLCLFRHRPIVLAEDSTACVCLCERCGAFFESGVKK